MPQTEGHNNGRHIWDRLPSHNNGRHSSHTQFWGPKRPWGDPPESIHEGNSSWHFPTQVVISSECIPRPRICPILEDKSITSQYEGLLSEEITKMGRNHLDRILKVKPDWSLRRTCRKDTKTSKTNLRFHTLQQDRPPVSNQVEALANRDTHFWSVSILYFKYIWGET